MSPLSKLLKRGSKPQAGQLYGAAVAQARKPVFYTSTGADDTPDGRLAVISLHILLILQRLSVPTRGSHSAGPMDDADENDEVAAPSATSADLDPALGRALMEVFVEDLDQSMRELGIGDMGVPKRVKKVMAQFYEHARRYRAIRPDDNQNAMHALLSDMIPGLTADPSRLKLLGAYVRDVECVLAAETTRNLAAGRLKFPEVNFTQHSRDPAQGGGVVT